MRILGQPGYLNKIYLAPVTFEDKPLADNKMRVLFCDADGALSYNVINVSLYKTIDSYAEEMRNDGRDGAVVSLEVARGETVSVPVEINSEQANALDSILQYAYEVGVMPNFLKKYPKEILKTARNKYRESTKQQERGEQPGPFEMKEIRKQVSRMAGSLWEPIRGRLPNPMRVSERNECKYDESYVPYQGEPEGDPPYLQVSLKSFIPVYADIFSADRGEVIDYIATTMSSDDANYLRAYRLSSLCFEPYIFENDTVIIDTNLRPQPGDLVIVMIEGYVSTKMFDMDDSGSLCLYNEMEQSIRYLPEQHHIHGVLVEAIKKFR